MLSELLQKLAQVAAAAAAQPAEWHPEWEPPVGWKSPENPKGWVQPPKNSQKEELFHWHKWKESGETPEAAEPMLSALQPLIYSYGVRGYVNRVPIAEEVLKQKAVSLTLKALRKYDPSKAQINTHLGRQLQSMKRFVSARQNLTRITEKRVGLYGGYNRAMVRLRDKLEREPTLTELADEMQVPEKTLSKFLVEMKDDVIASSNKDDPFLEETPQVRLVLQLVRFSLKPDEQIVLDYLTGWGTRPKIESTGEIARREGWSDSKVSNIKKKIAAKVKEGLP